MRLIVRPMEEHQMRHIPVHLVAVRWVVFLIVLVDLFASAVQSQVQGTTVPHTVEKGTVQAPSSNPPFVIRHARIFDGERIIAAHSIFIQDGKIQAIGNGLMVPHGTKEIDAAGDTLLPGLIDSHTHDWGDSAKQALFFGVTTELNMAGNPKYVAELKQAEADGKGRD